MTNNNQSKNNQHSDDLPIEKSINRIYMLRLFINY